MTKKDYEKFAFALNKLHNEGVNIRPFIAVFNQVLFDDNPLFQADKFERACYEGKHIRKSIKEA